MRLHNVLRSLWRALRVGLACPDSAANGWDWAAWALRLVLVGVHLSFSISPLLRPNIPLLYPSFAAFDDGIPFQCWGWVSILAAVLLVLLPPRVPWGLLSSAVSAFQFYFIGGMFGAGAGLLPGTTVYPFCGALSGLLLMRALWAWAEPQPWFKRHVSHRGRYGR